MHCNLIGLSTSEAVRTEGPFEVKASEEAKHKLATSRNFKVQGFIILALNLLVEYLGYPHNLGVWKSESHLSEMKKKTFLVFSINFH